MQFRILYVIGSLDVGGTEKQLYLLLKHIDREKFSPFVVSLSEGGYWAERIREIGIELKEVQNKKRYEMRRLFALANIIRKESPAIIHCYQPPGNRYGWLAAKLLGRQRSTVVSRRSFNYGGENLDAFKKVADRIVYRGAGAVICNSEALLGDLMREYGNGIKAAIIRNGIEPIASPERPDIEATKIDLGIPAGTKVVGTVGRLVPVKNHTLFLDVAREVLKGVPDTMFLVVGDGPMESDLKDYAKQHSISDRILFTGFRSDVIRLLSAFDLFLLTSCSNNGKGEGFPNVVMEAMMCGVPCIVSDVGGTRELFKEGEAGYLVSPGDPETFVRRSVELLNHPERRREMGLRGASIVKERYLASQMARDFEKLYFSIFKHNFDDEVGNE